jgi:hypothetical protein
MYRRGKVEDRERRRVLCARAQCACSMNKHVTQKTSLSSEGIPLPFPLLFSRTYTTQGVVTVHSMGFMAYPSLRVCSSRVQGERDDRCDKNEGEERWRNSSRRDVRRGQA